MGEHPILWKVRTRWAAVGAAVAVVAGAGGIAVSGATNAQLVPSKVNITPCRIMDTRTPGTVGPRSTPLGTGTTHTIQVTGKNGNCNIPSDAVSVMMNVTLVSPAQPGFITVFPAGATRPTASNLNYVAGQAPTPNLVDATLSSTGQLSFYASAGNVDLVADITSYTTGARLSTDQLAQRRWDKDRSRPLTVAVGGGLNDLAYDGTYIWTANGSVDTVSRINAATGVRKLPDIAVGDQPEALAFDGTNIWVANRQSDTVSRIDASTGATTASIAVGDRPAALTFDGTNIWVANFGSATLSRINAASGVKNPIDITVGGPSAGPIDLLFDGTNVWVALAGADALVRYSAATGDKVLPDISFDPGSAPGQMAFDGANIWVTFFSPGLATAARFSAATGTRVLPDAPAGRGPMAFDGVEMWVANATTNEVTRINPTTVAASADIPVGDLPLALQFDGTNMWVANNSSGTLQRLRPER